VEGSKLGGVAADVAMRGAEERRRLAQRRLADPGKEAALGASGGAFAEKAPTLATGSTGGGEDGVRLSAGAGSQVGHERRREARLERSQGAGPVRSRMARMRGGAMQS
jgi:hypothetical protein